jgi:hypothetical protein
LVIGLFLNYELVLGFDHQDSVSQWVACGLAVVVQDLKDALNGKPHSDPATVYEVVLVPGFFHRFKAEFDRVSLYAVNRESPLLHISLVSQGPVTIRLPFAVD